MTKPKKPSVVSEDYLGTLYYLDRVDSIAASEHIMTLSWALTRPNLEHVRAEANVLSERELNHYGFLMRRCVVGMKHLLLKSIGTKVFTDAKIQLQV